MRLAVVNLTNGELSGGYVKYLRNILPYFEQNIHIKNLHLFVPPNYVDLCLSEVSKLHTWPVSDMVFGFPELKRQLSKMSLDVVYFPTARWINCGAVSTVVMVRNMEPLVAPIRNNHLGEIVKNLARAYAARKACKQASSVLAVSRYVSNFLIKRWHIPSEKIAIVYHGVDRSLTQDLLCQPVQIPSDYKKDFIFTAGSIRPARGLEDILCAMSYLRSQGLDAYKLVIAGKVDPKLVWYQKKIKSWIETHKLSSKVSWIGNLNEKEMAWCYQNCDVFIKTSRVEACPNIALEAMSHGCICIAADNPPLPEIFGNTAVFYPPKDGKALAEAIKTVLGWDDNQQKAMSERARKRAAEFSWDVCAQKTMALLTKAAEIKQTSRY